MSIIQEKLFCAFPPTVFFLLRKLGIWTMTTKYQSLFFRNKIPFFSVFTFSVTYVVKFILTFFILHFFMLVSWTLSFLYFLPSPVTFVKIALFLLCVCVCLFVDFYHLEKGYFFDVCMKFVSEVMKRTKVGYV